MTYRGMEHEPQPGEKPEVAFWFFIRSVPAGGAPRYIKEGWVNVPLPCRRPRGEGPELHLGGDVDTGALDIVPDGVSIDADDAIKALRLFDRHEAADWWQSYMDDCYGTAVGEGLVFRAAEGHLVPPSMAHRLLPGLEDFDRIEP